MWAGNDHRQHKRLQPADLQFFCPLVDGNIVMLLLAFLDVNMLCNNKINKWHDHRSVTVGELETTLTGKH